MTAQMIIECRAYALTSCTDGTPAWARVKQYDLVTRLTEPDEARKRAIEHMAAVRSMYVKLRDCEDDIVFSVREVTYEEMYP